jgi:DNA-binding transcriptional ArsR family regulator
MVAADIDVLFHALAHPARRAVIERLGRGPATVSELAAPHGMALPTFLEHLRVLEAAALVHSHKQGRARVVRLRPQALLAGERWLADQHALWSRRLDQLDAFLQSPEPTDPPEQPPCPSPPISRP